MGSVQHTAATRARVIEAFRETGRVDLACKAAGCSRERHYGWLREHPEYRAAYEAALLPVADMLEDEAKRRAIEGLLEPRTVAGKAKLVRVYSDRLLEKLLEARHPAFKPKSQVELTGKDGGAVQTEHIIRFVDPRQEPKAIE